MKRRATHQQRQKMEEQVLEDLLHQDPKHLERNFVNPLVGYGTFTNTQIDKDQWVCTYTRGPLRDAEEIGQKDPFGFFFTFNGKKLCYDASEKNSGIGRYLNDEWVKPNCCVKLRVVCGRPCLFFKAIRTIQPNEELRFDYGCRSSPWRKCPRPSKTSTQKTGSILARTFTALSCGEIIDHTQTETPEESPPRMLTHNDTSVVSSYHTESRQNEDSVSCVNGSNLPGNDPDHLDESVIVTTKPTIVIEDMAYVTPVTVDTGLTVKTHVLDPETGLFVTTDEEIVRSDDETLSTTKMGVLDPETGVFISEDDDVNWMSKEDMSQDESQDERLDNRKYKIQKTKRSHNGKRVCDKKLACLFCKKLLRHRICDHLAQVHSNEVHVAEALSLPLRSRRRKLAYQLLKNRGNFLHNVSVLDGSVEGQLIVVRRSRSNSGYEGKYIPCPACYGFFVSDDLWRHYKICPHKDSVQCKETQGTGIKAQSNLLLSSALLPIDNENKVQLEPILKSMHKDDVFRSIENDPLIVKFGLILKTKLGMTRKNDVAQRMRQLGRLKLQLGVEDFTDVIRGAAFDKVIKATYEICKLTSSSDDISIFEKPGLALRLGHNLIKVAHVKYGQALRAEDDIGVKQAETFRKLLKHEWGDSISSIASASLATNKFNKPQILPLTSDLVKLKVFIDKQLARLTPALNSNPNYDSWRSLCEATMAKVVLFNKRRGGEVQNMRLDVYVHRKRHQDDFNEEIFNSLSPVEQQLTKRLELVEVRGKQNKTVATLLTREMVTALDTLVKTRSQCGIPPTNKFLFASQGSGPILTWTTIHAMATEAGCVHPENISSSRLRKYIATVAQVLNLDNSELSWLAGHLQHDMATHMEFYRKHDSVLELAKISKLLLVAESGNLGNYAGRTLKEIDVEDIHLAPDTEEPSGNGNTDSCQDHIDQLLAGDDGGHDIDVHELGDSSLHQKQSKTRANGKSAQSDSESSRDAGACSLKYKRGRLHTRKQRTRQRIDSSESSSDEEEQPRQKTCRKRRWTTEENAAFDCAFECYIKKRQMPPGRFIRRVVETTIKTRSVAMVRAKVNNVIKGKL